MSQQAIKLSSRKDICRANRKFPGYHQGAEMETSNCVPQTNQFHVLTHCIIHNIKHCFIQTNPAHRKQFGTTDADEFVNVD